MKSKLAVLIFLIFSQVSSLSSAARSNIYDANPNGYAKKIIAKFEAGFLKFTESLAKVLIKYKPLIDEKTFNTLKKPLIIFIYNLNKNTLKYHKDYVKKLKSTNANAPLNEFSDNKLFYYDILPENMRKYGLMGFKMEKRIMYLNPLYNPNSVMDNLIAYHEMVHAYQDSLFRDNVIQMGERGKKALKKYLVLLNKMIRNPDIEPVAYAIEIEVLNLLFKNKLRRMVKSGYNLPVGDFARVLKAKSRISRNSLTYLLKYSIYYFAHDCKIFSYSLAYRKAIIEDHMKIGYKFYASNNKFIKEYQNRASQTPAPSRREENRRGLGGIDIN
jgi:hypothetical protein